jgi:hypothetical protein
LPAIRGAAVGRFSIPIVAALDGLIQETVAASWIELGRATSFAGSVLGARTAAGANRDAGSAGAAGATAR